MRRCPGRRAAASLLRASPQPTGLPPARPRHTHAHTRTRTRPNPHAHWCARDRCLNLCRTSWRRWASRWCARCRRTCWSASRAAPTAPSFRIRNGSRPKGVDRRLRAAARPSIHPSIHTRAAPPRPNVCDRWPPHAWMDAPSRAAARSWGCAGAGGCERSSAAPSGCAWRAATRPSAPPSCCAGRRSRCAGRLNDAPCPSFTGHGASVMSVLRSLVTNAPTNAPTTGHHRPFSPTRHGLVALAGWWQCRADVVSLCALTHSLRLRAVVAHWCVWPPRRRSDRTMGAQVGRTSSVMMP
jgi:hypothetical protein